MRSMRAAVFYKAGDLRVEEREKPVCGAGQVLLRVRACGICGTDAHIFCGDEGAAKTPAGTVLGHEFAGEVAAIGAGVTGIAVGDRACVDPNRLCGKCDFCRRGIEHFCTDMMGIGTTVDGGFAEYCAVPASQVYVVPPTLAFEKAAMAEPVSCCLHGIELADIHMGDTVAVIGCGMIGLLMIQLARIAGAARIIAVEPIEEKRALARRCGADVVLAPDAAGINEQIDSVIECVGKVETVQFAIAMAGKRSTVLLFGLTAPADKAEIEPFALFKKEITLRASFINPYTFPAAVRLIEGGRLDVSSMVYATASLTALSDILVDEQKRRAGKYIITM